MPMTSMDIRDRQFKKSIRGYSKKEVDEFLEKVYKDYETLYRENSEFKEKIFNYEEKLEHYFKLENTIQNTLLLAENAAEQAKQSAQKEAELIIKNANESSRNVIEKANNDVLKINDDYERLKQEFTKFRTKYKNFLVSNMEIFNEMEKDFIKSYNVGSVIEENVSSKEIETSSANMNNKKFTDNLDNVKSFFVNEK